jgi:hypothetical protein
MKQLQEADPVLEARYGATERYIFDLSMHAHLLQAIYDPEAPKIPLNEALNNPKAKLSMTESLTLVIKVHGAEAMPERAGSADQRQPAAPVEKRDSRKWMTRLRRGFCPKVRRHTIERRAR